MGENRGLESNGKFFRWEVSLGGLEGDELT